MVSFPYNPTRTRHRPSKQDLALTFYTTLLPPEVLHMNKRICEVPSRLEKCGQPFLHGERAHDICYIITEGSKAHSFFDFYLCGGYGVSPVIRRFRISLQACLLEENGRVYGNPYMDNLLKSVIKFTCLGYTFGTIGTIKTIKTTKTVSNDKFYELFLEVEINIWEVCYQLAPTPIVSFLSSHRSFLKRSLFCGDFCNDNANSYFHRTILKRTFL
jgi:hypothetical protein